MSKCRVFYTSTENESIDWEHSVVVDTDDQYEAYELAREKFTVQERIDRDMSFVHVIFED